jgi:type I restriction enzyme S subunit
VTGGILGAITCPPDWQEIPFGRLVDRRRECGRPDLPALSVFLDEGVVPRDSRDDNFNRLGADLSLYLSVEPGDMVFNKLRTWQGGLGVSAYRGIVSPAYFVCRPRAAAVPRFLHFALRSSFYLAELTRISKWMPPSQFDIAWEDLREVLIRVPHPTVQRAIADYLDTETTRIDAIVAAKQRLVELLREKYWSSVDEAFSPLPRPQAIGRFAESITDGPFGSSLTSAHYSEDGQGARVIRLGNVGRGLFRDDDRAFIPLRHYETLKGHEAIEGDLIVAGLGDENQPLGRACVVPAGIGPAIVKADCFRFRLDRKRLLPEFAALFLSSPTGGSLAQETTRGSTRQRGNIGAIASVRVPAPPLDIQTSIVGHLRKLQARSEHGVELLERQIGLLHEHREALISGGVTGQIEIAGVAA